MQLERAAAIPGVTVVHDGGLVAVCAGDRGTAARALQQLEARWELVDQPSEAAGAEHQIARTYKTA